MRAAAGRERLAPCLVNFSLLLQLPCHATALAAKAVTPRFWLCCRQVMHGHAVVTQRPSSKPTS